jgi:extracellular factor (EF) 3-hydroxypalmitic acid methyl ester biosynthesis protein
VLEEFKIILQGKTIYSGRATVRNVLDAGSKVVCEATLRELDWTDLDSGLGLQREGEIAKEFKTFLNDWQKFCKVSPEFKVVIADMQTFLHHLQLWLGQVELKIKALPTLGQKDLEQQTMKQIGELFVPAFDALHERLEMICAKVSEEFRPAYQAFAQRQLHSLVLCSPFANRAYNKPLGYAGDYEMVNMIALNPYQGDSLYARVVNLWFLSQWPSKAHRNRLSYLKEKLEGETWRAAHMNRTARIFNFACGPAIEVQNFLSGFPFSEHAELTLADFNQETLEHLGKSLGHIKERLALRTKINFQKKSVNQLLKEGGKRTSAPRPQYDFVYCAGLFDYLSDNTCTQMMEVFYDWVAPGGLLAVTNVADEKPFRHMLEFVLDWHLIYRGMEKGAALFPKHIPEEARSVKKDSTGVNVFIEARKPRDA